MTFPEIPHWLRTRLMYALILTAALGFGVRFNALLNESEPEKNTPLQFSALEPAAGEEVKEESAAATVPPPAQPPAASPADHTVPATAAAGEASEQPIEWKDATDADMEYSAVQMTLFEDLSKRRKELEQKEKILVTREALLQAAEKNLEQKYKELSDLRGEVEELLKKQSEEESARVVSLVKIYEGMKAKDAARIFDTLDMDVLLQVLGRMSERKSAPIIAAMNPERARSVTIMLAEQKALPTLEDDLTLQ